MTYIILSYYVIRYDPSSVFASVDAVLAYNVLREKIGMDPLIIPPPRVRLDEKQKRNLQMKLLGKEIQQTMVLL